MYLTVSVDVSECVNAKIVNMSIGTLLISVSITLFLVLLFQPSLNDLFEQTSNHRHHRIHFFFSLFIDRATRQFIRQIKLRIENKTDKNKLRNNHMKLNK